MATRLQAIIDFVYKGGGVQQATGDMGKLSQGIAQVGKSALQMGLESAALDARTSMLSDKMRALSTAVIQNKMTFDQAEAEYKKFESTLAKVPPKAEETRTALQRMGDAATGVTNAWSQIATPLNQTLELFQKVGQSAQKAYAFVSEGAQLGLAEDKFDRLAASIGTTADALMSELRTATRGTVSDMQLLDGASSLINLGLAKNSDEAVRLGTLIGKLGWDMNQVTLTIANQSTMRLDALGLSVDAVKGRVDEFKATGMATDEAFKWALIEAGEEKLSLLGDAADTAAGKLKILETNAKNFGDSFKKTFGENFVGNLNAAAGGIFETEEGASGLGETLANIATNVSFLGFIRMAKEGIADLGEESKNAQGDISGMGGVVQELPPSLDSAAAGVKRFGDETKVSRQSVIEATAAVDGWMASMNTVTTLTPQAIQQSHQQAAAIYQETSPAYAELQDKIFQTSQSYNMNEQAARAANLANQQIANTVPTVTGAIYASTEAVAAYNARLGEYYMAAQDTDDANMLLNSGIRSTSGGLVEVSNLTEQQTDDLERMQATYDKAAQTIRDYELGVKGANLTDDERNKKIEEQQAIMATLAGNIGQLTSAGVSYVEVAGQMVGFGPAVADAFTQSASAMGANANQLAAIQLAFSDMAPAQAEAILKEAALAAEVQKLTQEIISGNMTVYEARDAYIAFQNGLNDSTIAVNSTTGSVILMNDGMVSAATSTQTLLDKFGEFPDEVSTTVKVNTGDAESKVTNLYNKLRELGDPALPTGGGSSGGSSSGGGGGGNLGPGFAGGADFVVPPGYPNDGYPMRVQSGEHVTVTPAGQQRGGNTYNLYVTAMDGGANVSREFNYLKSLAGA